VTESGALLGLVLGVGLLLIWRSGPRAPQPRTAPRRPGRRQLLLAEAGLTGINAAQLLALQVGLGLLATVVVLLTTGTVTVSLVFGLFGFALPYVQVRRLAARRTADLREVWPEVVDNLASAVRAGMSLPEALSALSTPGRRCCAHRSPASPRSTGPPAGSAPASTGSRTTSPTRSATASHQGGSRGGPGHSG
jgi:tight adherence protein B